MALRMKQPKPAASLQDVLDRVLEVERGDATAARRLVLFLSSEGCDGAKIWKGNGFGFERDQPIIYDATKRILRNVLKVLEEDFENEGYR
jgi:hypothetical protein